MEPKSRQVRYIIGRGVPKKTLTVTLNTYSAIQAFAKQEGFTIVEAIWRLVRYSLVVYSESKKASEAAIPGLTDEFKG